MKPECNDAILDLISEDHRMEYLIRDLEKAWREGVDPDYTRVALGKVRSTASSMAKQGFFSPEQDREVENDIRELNALVLQAAAEYEKAQGGTGRPGLAFQDTRPLNKAKFNMEFLHSKWAGMMFEAIVKCECNSHG